jgi:hypothetical protein
VYGRELGRERLLIAAPPRVRRHALGRGERLDGRPDAREPLGVERCDRHRLEERLEAEPADGARPAAVGRTWLPPVA